MENSKWPSFGQTLLGCFCSVAVVLAFGWVVQHAIGLNLEPMAMLFFIAGCVAWPIIWYLLDFGSAVLMTIGAFLAVVFIQVLFA